MTPNQKSRNLTPKATPKLSSRCLQTLTAFKSNHPRVGSRHHASFCCCLLVIILGLTFNLLGTCAQQNSPEDSATLPNAPDAATTSSAPGSKSFTSDPEIEEIRRLFGMDETKADPGKQDIFPPEVENRTQPNVEPGNSILFAARVWDNSPNPEVYVHYRKIGGDNVYLKVLMKPKTEGSEYYEVQLPESLIAVKGIHYFIEAIDQAGNKGYSTVDLQTPHLLLPVKKVHFLPWIIFISAIIVIPTAYILLRRKVTASKDAERTRQLRKFITRQKQLEKERKRLYKKHLDKMRGHTKSAPDQLDDEAEEYDEDEYVALAELSHSKPEKRKSQSQEQTPRSDSATRRQHRPADSRPDSAPHPGLHPPTQPARSGSQPVESAKPKSADEILKQFDAKIGQPRSKPRESFDLKSEVDKLLQDDDFLKTIKSKPPSPPPET